jgi:hopanoid biosynthesis associated protein HpnK
MLATLSAELGYAAVACGAFVEGEAVVLSAGALAHAGKLGLPGVVLAGACGSFIWGQVWFSVGRVVGPTLLARRPNWRSRASAVDRWLERAGPWVVVGGRFVAGMGTVLPAVIGASGFRRARFVLLDAIGAFLWSTVLSVAGFGVGRGLAQFVAQPSGYEIALAVVVALVLFLGLTQLVQRRASRSAGPLSLPKPERRVVITADDFGLALPFNEAIEMAYESGSLTTASLMVGEAATADAVERARRHPGLCVGLHLALCEARPVSSPARVSRLVNAQGEFYGPVTALIRFTVGALHRGFRQELEGEIRAQFCAFADAGLRFDHVSGHNNLHLHPAVLPILVRVAREFDVSAIRVPYEPLLPAWRASRTGLFARFCVWAVMGPWTAWARRRLEAEGFEVNDQIFGVFDCGAMNLERLLGIVRHLPPGSSEIHVHPATGRCPQIDRTTPSYAHEAELEALLSPELGAAIAENGVRLVAGYRELIALHRSVSGGTS